MMFFLINMVFCIYMHADEMRIFMCLSGLNVISVGRRMQCLLYAKSLESLRNYTCINNSSRNTKQECVKILGLANFGGLAIDVEHAYLYYTDSQNGRIAELSMSGGQTRIVIDELGTIPTDIVVDGINRLALCANKLSIGSVSSFGNCQ